MGELKAHCMAQTNNDADDLQDFLPFVNHYLNEGYDILVGVWEPGKHVEARPPQTDGLTVEYPILVGDADVPRLPYWCHRYIADYATWLLYRNGNPQKQSRGERYRISFEEGKNRMTAEGGKAGAEVAAGGGDMSRIVNVFPDKPQAYDPPRQAPGFDPLE